jgi:hypothetical protein
MTSNLDRMQVYTNLQQLIRIEGSALISYLTQCKETTTTTKKILAVGRDGPCPEHTYDLR